MTLAQADTKRLLHDDIDSVFERLELTPAVQSRVRHWLQLEQSSISIPAAIIEAVYHEHEPKRVHATTLMKLLQIGAVDFCKQLNRFIDELYTELSDAFISEAKEFIGQTVQLWVLYCKYRSIFDENWTLSDQNHTSTLFTCGWLLFLTVRSEIRASWRTAPDLLYRFFALVNAVIARLGVLCPPEAKKLALAQIDSEILGACHSLVTVVVERLTEEGIWFENDLVRLVAGLGRHMDRVVCSSNEVWQCWLLDGRVFFSDQLRSMCERTLLVGLSPIIRSPSKSADTSPVCLMPGSVKWLLKLTDDAKWLSNRVLQHWPSFQPEKLEHVLQQHRQRPFRFGSNDAMITSHRQRLSVLVFYRLLEALVEQEATRRADGATSDFSQWLDSTGFLKVMLYLSTQVIVGCYQIRLTSQEQLTSAFDVAPLEAIAALRNLLKTPLIDDQLVRNYLFFVYEQFVLFDAWKDQALKILANNGQNGDFCYGKIESLNPGHVRSLYRAAHSFAIDAVQFLTRILPAIGFISGPALSVINHIIRCQAALLVAPLGLDAVVVCTLYGLSKISEKCTIKLIHTYKLLLKHRSAGDYSNGPDLLRFYNQSFVPAMKSTLFSVCELGVDHESSVISSDSSLAVPCLYNS